MRLFCLNKKTFIDKNKQSLVLNQKIFKNSSFFLRKIGQLSHITDKNLPKCQKAVWDKHQNDFSDERTTQPRRGLTLIFWNLAKGTFFVLTPTFATVNQLPQMVFLDG
ncbi:MAG: hypothetical protein RLZZ628_3122 [Bacteroidota bacterium]